MNKIDRGPPYIYIYTSILCKELLVGGSFTQFESFDPWHGHQCHLQMSFFDVTNKNNPNTHEHFEESG